MKTPLLLLLLALASPLAAAPKSPVKSAVKAARKFTVAEVNAARKVAGFDRRAMGLPGIVSVGTSGRDNHDAWIQVMARDQACAQAAAKVLGTSLAGVPIRIEVSGVIRALPAPAPKPNQALLNAAKARELRQRVQAIRQFVETSRLTKPAFDALQNEIKQLEQQITALQKPGATTPPHVGGQAPPVSKKFAAKNPPGTYVQDQLLLTIAPGAVGDRIQKELAKAIPGHRIARAMLGGRVLVLQLPATMNVEQGLKAVGTAKCVKTAELHGIVTIQRQLNPGALEKLRPRR